MEILDNDLLYADLRNLTLMKGALDPKDFNCKRCGLCCGLVMFSEEEYKIAKMPALKQKVLLVPIQSEFKKCYIAEKTFKTLGKKFPKFKETRELAYVPLGFKVVCAFLDYDQQGRAACKIYDHRPEVCRKWGVEFLMPCPGFLKDYPR
jgi:Fe-S-cluster containining protein